MVSTKCFFTGHRILSNEDKKKLSQTLECLITKLEKEGIYEYYAGGAVGFDYIAARAVISVRKKLPHLCLELCLPCYGSEKKWNDKEKYRFQLLKAEADRICYISEEEYFDGCMQKRNKAMADICGTCVAFSKNPRSGTQKTVRYAESVGCRIINLADEI